MERSIVTTRFVERRNRFLIVAELDDGHRVMAYLPNTGRLAHLTEPGRPFILRYEPSPTRITDYTAIRAWDGTWVALEASLAPHLMVEWLTDGNPLGPFGTGSEIETEVAVAGHRLDLRVQTTSGPVWVEVKSGGRSDAGTGLLSKTPSARGIAHLETLARLAQAGERCAVAFVVQRGDIRRLLVGGDADLGWIEAVRSANDAGVAVLAYGCDVTEDTVRITRALDVVWEEPPSGPFDPDLGRLHRQPDP